MIDTSKADTAHWLILIDTQLHEIFLKLAADFDISPARHFQLEGLVAAAHADGAALEELLKFCLRNAPPNCAVRIDAQRQTLQFDFWQKRAPVYPSTRD